MSRTPTTTFRTLLTFAPLCLLAVAASFGLGMQTAGDLRTIQFSSATDTPRGDMNDDGSVDAKDVILILEISQGYREATPEQLLADPNDNGTLGVDDALRILRSITSR